MASLSTSIAGVKLAPDAAAAVRELTDQVHAEFGDRVRAVHLYGARAAGPGDGGEADADLLVILDDKRHADELRILELSRTLLVKREVDLCATLVTPDEWAKLVDAGDPLARQVLGAREAPSADPAARLEAAAAVVKARAALDDGDALLSLGRAEGAASRFGAAGLMAARAALGTVLPSADRRRAEELFALHFARTGPLEASLVDDLRALRALRADADDAPFLSIALPTARDAGQRARRLVDAVEQHLTKSGFLG